MIAGIAACMAYYSITEETLIPRSETIEIREKFRSALTKVTAAPALKKDRIVRRPRTNALRSNEIPYVQARMLVKLDMPVDLTADVLDITYILERSGKLWRAEIDPAGNRQVTHFADLADENTCLEQGFTSIALHPNFHARGHRGYGCLYAVASEKAGNAIPNFRPLFLSKETEHHQNVLYEWQLEDPLALEFSGTKREVLRVTQPSRDNNMSSLTFDHAGNLYVGVGDGGNANPLNPDLSQNASCLLSIYGKVLRIDPKGNNSANGQYGIPATNPFRLVDQALPELYAYGLRSPNGLSVDPLRGWLCISETGFQNASELNISRSGAEHFGWDFWDADGESDDTETQLAAEQIVSSPAVKIPASDNGLPPGVGGFIYTGERFPSLVGKMVFGDRQGNIMSAGIADFEISQSGDYEMLSGLSFVPRSPVVSLRPGARGEIFLLCEGGEVLELVKNATSTFSSKRKRKPLMCQLTANHSLLLSGILK